MDALLGRITSQAVNYAIRSGVALTSTYAIKHCARLVKAAPKGSEREELLKLQIRLESKIRIISPAIDMIELIAARGNTSLESAVSLTKDIRWEIQTLGVRLAKAANEEELLKRGSKRAKSRAQNELELKRVVENVKRLLDQIEDAVPLINLAITTSGVNLSTNLPATVSPSRLLQASTFLTAADSLYANSPGKFVQVGPSYLLSVYMLFAGHANRLHDDEGAVRETTWKEVIHKARLKLVRVPLRDLYHLPGEQASSSTESDGYFPESFPEDNASLEFAYQLMVVEDLDDGRVHTYDDGDPQPGPFEDIKLAGIRDVVPIHQVSKIFYADTGKILNIGTDGEVNSPVLLIKRDVHAEPPRRMMERQMSIDSESEDDTSSQQDNVPSDTSDQINHDIPVKQEEDVDEQTELDAQLFRESTPATPIGDLPSEPPVLDQATVSSLHWRLPADLDPEWIALEVFTEDPDSDDDDEDSEITSSQPASSRPDSLERGMSDAFANLNLRSPSPAASPFTSLQAALPGKMIAPSGPVKTSLSLLEMLIRLTALQQFRQASHLTIEDELLNFFLEDNATTGAGSDAEYRQRIRRDARRRVGFDPYDESPIKRRGEEYLAHPRSGAEDWHEDALREMYRDGSYFDGEERSMSPSNVRQSIEYARSDARGGSPYTQPSSPSPQLRRPLATPGRSSPGASRSTPLRQRAATPPASVKGRHMTLKGESGHRPRSPLAKEVHSRGDDSTLGTSPSSVPGEEKEE